MHQTTTYLPEDILKRIDRLVYKRKSKDFQFSRSKWVLEAITEKLEKKG